MSEYWKSTPSYWCKFCSIYVRDTGIERKNHETSAKHQNAIQRNLRELQKGTQREERDKQRAKDEVARLNGLVSGSGKATLGERGERGIIGVKDAGKQALGSGPTISAAAQRKKHAEQLAAMGVKLPDDLKQEITGMGGWQKVSERVVEDAQPWTLASIKSEEDSKEDVKEALAKGVRKRKAGGEDNEEEEEVAPASRAWGSKFRQYPGASAGDGGDGEVDLDALLGGVTAKKAASEGEKGRRSGKTPGEVKEEENENKPEVKREDSTDEKPIAAIPDIAQAAEQVKQEEQQEPVVPTVVFKKRKVKR
ncbi:hypothetical protein B0A50_05771 [Salinomyces thailandicus]|uniref:U1-C C2H2-type zinc finger domain-containing protein n=1 Tax=Salinomyces thailandicus TaxID=706561 RepID=A0A4U0TUL6_9PEZI|nr:hypothetical protein B0A50_05771 [Salinomyces thailandica]